MLDAQSCSSPRLSFSWQWPGDAVLADKTQGSLLGWQMAVAPHIACLSPTLDFSCSCSGQFCIVWTHFMQTASNFKCTLCTFLLSALGLLWCYVSSVDLHTSTALSFRGTLLRGTAYTSLEVQMELSPHYPRQQTP